MGFFTRLLSSVGEADTASESFELLTFGPAVLHIGRLADRARPDDQPRDALARAVARLQFPAGFSRDRVIAAAAEMSRRIEIEGEDGISARIRSELSPAARADAMRLALVAAQGAAPGDPDAPILLARLATEIGMSGGEFRALSEAARRLA